MKTVKVLNEEIDAFRFEAKGIFEAAKRADRELNEEESKRFDEITDKKSGLKKQLGEAEDREKAIAEVSLLEGRRKSLEDIDNDLSSQSASQPRHTLPINGQLPGSRRTDDDRIYVKAARLKAFKDERTAFAAGMWIRSIVSKLYGRGQDQSADLYCYQHGMEVTNSSYEGSGVSGGYLVPAQVASTIIEVRENVGIARRIANIQPMTSDMLPIPKKSGGLTVYYPAELGTITDSDKSWSQVGLAAEKRAVASKISQELIDDALINVVDNVFSEMAYALALQEDNEMINGTGASTYGHVQGLLSSIGSAGVSTAAASSTWAAVTLAELMTAMSLLPDRFNRNPVFICSSNFFWACLARLQAAGGGNAISDLQGGPTGKQFLGVPVYTTSQMPTATAVTTKSLLFGQFDMSVILGDRMGIRIGRDDSTGFLNDYTTLKATSRYDIKVHEAGDGTNPGAFIAFSTHS